MDAGDPLKFYNKRIEELTTLRNKAISRTVKDLINKAILKSKELLEKNLALQQQTEVYIQDETEKYNSSMLTIVEKIEELDQEITKMKALEGVSEAQRNQVLDVLHNAKRIGEQTKKNKEAAMRLQSIVMPKTALAFQNLLLDLIYKPGVATFHYDTIVDGLKFIGGLFIPAFDSIMTAKNTPISAKMRKIQYISNGDKIIVYIEQYTDVMDKWETLADEYYKIIKDTVIKS